MKHLRSKDLAYLRHGLKIFSNPRQMARMIRKAALKEGPSNWVWKYGWSAIEDAIYSLWPAEGDRNPLRRRTSHGDPNERLRER